ncbi:unnamed protein product [Rotaria magnacalcarata]|uniref:Tetratricopeptide repeat protein n=1 Tax=Rotaria magnacalcarata TaxID=392030 RepID=A0A8S2KIF2_9BILA|nr:unnamed protein product [Rotaria magnacalcarata]
MQSDSTANNNNIKTYWQISLFDFPNDYQNILDSLEQIPSSINHIKTFEDIIECEQFIRSLSDDDCIVFITTVPLGQQIIPKIHQLRQVLVIYIYSTEIQSNESWFRQFRGIYSQLNQLATLMPSRYRRRPGREVDDLFSFNIFGTDGDQEKSTAELDGHFIHSQLLIETLQKMKSTSTVIEEFIHFCQDHEHIKDQNCYLKLVHEFKNEYSSDKAVWWYTRDSFVYRMLNKALRVQNIDVLFVFRFFLRDIAQQLKENQWSSPGYVYRGQSLSKYELKRLQQSVGKLISINSLFSTTLYRDVAEVYVGDTDTEGLEKVLFIIYADPLIDGIKPFADITFLSEFHQEGETLFMSGSIFQIESIQIDENGVWLIELKLFGDHDEVLKPIFNYLQRESRRCELDLLEFGNLLHDMGKFEDSKNYYNRCLKLLPSDDHAWKPYCYYLLGLVATESGDDKCALNLLSKSLNIRRQTLKSSDPSIADTLTAIARVHYNSCNFDQALQSYHEALGIFQQAFREYDRTSAMIYTNIGVVCKEQKLYSDALDYHKKAEEIRLKHLPASHFRFGTSQNNMGEVYQCLGEYDTALEYYERALEIYKKSLPSEHIEIAIVLVNKGSIKEEKADLQTALPFYKKALNICLGMWPVEDRHLLRIKDIIQSAENARENMELSEPLPELFKKLFRPFKCIASLDPRTLYRQTHHLFVDNIICCGLVIHDQRCVYVADIKKHEVREYRLGDNNEAIEASGNGQGDGLNQLGFPTNLFVDRQKNIYVSDNSNHRIMKQNKGAKEGLFVDTKGTRYVAEGDNQPITVIAGGNGQGAGANQLN